VRWSCLVVVGLLAAACTDAITLEVASDRDIPKGLDAICLGIADASAQGGQFGRAYPLTGKLATLPQTLRVEPGTADGAFAWVRGDRGGVPVLGTSAKLDFSTDVSLALDRCVKGPAGSPSTRGDPVGPTSARLAVSQGAGGTVIIAVGATAEILDAKGSALVSSVAPELPPGTVVEVIAADLDGDCDDDVIVATSDGPPALWRRDGLTFTEVASLGTTAIDAVAAADVDRNGTIDLVTGAGSTLTLWRNDGSGTFSDRSTIANPGRATSIRAIALGDVDGDGFPDLVVGQRGDPLVAWLGTGTFQAADGVISPVPLDVSRLVLADIDGDYDPDLAVAVAGGPLRLFINREGLLEDQSFVRLPQPAPVAHAVAIGGWDAACEPDAIVASDAGGPALHGTGQDTALTADGTLPPATDIVMADVDDDGDLDAIVAGGNGVQWLAR